MNPTRRLALLALILGSFLGGRPAVCHAQTAFPPSNFDPRYATWDTTLVRDTLGLTFERLFPLADSLRVKPEDLKFLSTRWGWSLGRLVKMADSMGVIIDSVGPIMDRERFNPLANVTTRSSLTYVSRYSPAASGDGWENTLDHSLVRGPIVAASHVGISLQQNGSGGRLGRTEGRTATSNLSWKFSPRYSLGATLTSIRNDNVSPSGLYARADRNNSFGIVANSRPPVWHGFTPSMTANLDLNSQDQIGFQKRGWKIFSRAGLQYSTPLVSHNLTFSGSSSDFTASPTDPIPDDALFYPKARTRESDTHLQGTLTAFRNKPVEVNLNYQLDNVRNHVLTPVNDSSFVESAVRETLVTPRTNSPLNRIASGSVDAALRIQPVSYGTLDLDWKAGNSANENSTLIAGNNSGNNHGFSAAARLQLPAGITVQSNFSATAGKTEYPKRDFPRGGYGQDQRDHHLSGNASIPVGSLFTLSVDSDIQLTSSRYSRIGSPLSIPLANDDARQYYKLTLLPPAIKKRMSNTIGIKVDRRQYVNLPAASTAANYNERIYTASWTWSYLLLPGLSANQVNSLVADYTTYPFNATANSLRMDYQTQTNLDASIGPRWNIHTTHTAQFSPKGNYRPLPDDPTEYLSLSEKFQNYSLGMRIDYAILPPFITANIAPLYTANSRSTAANGSLAPQRSSKTLGFNWGASVNIPVGGKGSLSGSLLRNENSSRDTQFKDSIPTIGRRSSTQSLSGTLTFTLNL